MVIVATTAIVFFGCKKENTDAVLKGEPLVIKAYTPPQVDDMNAYLKDFKQKMRTVTRDQDEMLDIEEAAWHLSSLANYDFANANVEFTDLRYDTLYYQVDVNNELVSLVDLNTVYASMSSDIDAFYQGLDLQEKHFRFIGTSVSEDGLVRVSLLTSYIILDHTWYFDDDWEASLHCFEYFDQNTQYVWNGSAIDTLEHYINFLEGCDYIMPGEPLPPRVYFVYVSTQQFNYTDYIDPYGSDFLGNSRIFAVEADTYAVPTLDFNMMCYCLDSYLALPFEYVGNGGPSLGNQRPVNWKIDAECILLPYHKWHIFCHIVNVIFAQAVVSNEEPINY